jgi:hypothetical protein
LQALPKHTGCSAGSPCAATVQRAVDAYLLRATQFSFPRVTGAHKHNYTQHRLLLTITLLHSPPVIPGHAGAVLLHKGGICAQLLLNMLPELCNAVSQLLLQPAAFRLWYTTTAQDAAKVAVQADAHFLSFLLALLLRALDADAAAAVRAGAVAPELSEGLGIRARAASRPGALLPTRGLEPAAASKQRRWQACIIILLLYFEVSKATTNHCVLPRTKR